MTFQAAYVGQKNTHLMVPMPYQQLELLPNGTTQESPYLSGNPTLKNEISHYFRHCLERQPDLQCLASCFAKAIIRRFAVQCSLHLLEMHDGFERLLRIVGRPDNTNIALLAEPLQSGSGVGTVLLRRHSDLNRLRDLRHPVRPQPQVWQGHEQGGHCVHRRLADQRYSQLAYRLPAHASGERCLRHQFARSQARL